MKIIGLFLCPVSIKIQAKITMAQLFSREELW